MNNGEENEFGNQSHEMQELRQEVATLMVMVKSCKCHVRAVVGPRTLKVTLAILLVI